MPISYGPRQKWLEAQKGLDREEEMFEKLLPRFSYEMIALTYDPTRKLTNAQKVKGIGTRNVIGAPVPYTLDLSLYLETKSLNDGWQIVEQILPFFSPTYTVRVRHFPMDRDSDTPMPENEYDMPITLTSLTWADDWTGDVGERRTIEWTLEFSVKVWFYGPAPYSGGRGSLIYDSRAIVSIPTDDDQILAAMNRGTSQVGIETGYAVTDSEIAIFANEKDRSPSIINNITDSEEIIVKVIRDINDI